MSDQELDTLARAARNRGLKLVRSRVRTPGKRRFGKAGLQDQTGEPVFGIDAQGPMASPEAVEDYLRALEAGDWGRSLGASKIATGQCSSKRSAADQPQRARGARPVTNQKPRIRPAKAPDAASLVALIEDLGVTIDERQVRQNLAALAKLDDKPLVATIGGKVVGLCGVGKRVAIHRSQPIGRITALVVAKEARNQGIGRLLVEAAEHWMRERGCYLVEVTSNDRLSRAHAFYRHLGFCRTSIRFAKTLSSSESSKPSPANRLTGRPASSGPA